MNVRLVSVTDPIDVSLTPEGLIVYTARVSSPQNQHNTETAPRLLKYCIDKGHWSVFSMVDMTLEIETSRAISAQILRHKSFDFQEFCVAEGTAVSCKTAGSGWRRRPIEELYARQQDGGRLPFARVFDEERGTLVPAQIREVFKTGLKPVYRLTTETGKTVDATADHKFLTPSGFCRLSDLKIADFVGTNGQPVYQSIEWMTAMRARLPRMALGQIAEAAGCTPHTIRKWLKKHKLQFTHKEVAEYTPVWNKGLPSEQQPMFGKTAQESTRKKQRGSSRKGADSPLYVDGRSKNAPWRLQVWQWQSKYKNFVLKRDGGACKHCGAVDNLQLDHIEPVSARPDLAFDILNLQVLCRGCHAKKDIGPVRETVRFAKIASIELVGERQTYDLEVEHTSHNYVANGIVTHNSQRYAEVAGFETYEPRAQDTKNRQNSTDTLSADVKEWFARAQDVVHERGADLYKKALDRGIAKECARFLLPISTTTRLYMKGSVRSWIHYFEVRCGPETQLEHREVALAAREIFRGEFPIVSEALWKT